MSVTRHMFLALPMALLALAGTGAAQTPRTPDLHALSREARTTVEHADLSQRFRQQAEAFESRAAAEEATVKALTAKAAPFQHKWPEVRMPDVTAAKRRAVEARRAARESREMAERHLRLAVEALATTAPDGRGV